MGLFDIFRDLSSAMTGKKQNKLAERTGGIFSDDNLLIDTNTGNLSATANIPSIQISSTIQDKWGKAEAFRTGDYRQSSPNPSLYGKDDPAIGNQPSLVPDVLTGSETQDDLSHDIARSTQDTHQDLYGGDGSMAYRSNPLASRTNPPVIPETGSFDPNVVQVPALADGRDQLRKDFPSNQASDDLAQYKTPSFMPTEDSRNTNLRDILRGEGSAYDLVNGTGNGRKRKYPWDDEVASVTGQNPETGETLKVKTEDGVVMPDRFQKREKIDIEAKDDPNTPQQEGAKNSPKWKDILMSVIQNISQTDFSKYSPDQQLSALLGAAGGGAIRGAVTGRYAGKLDAQNQNKRTDRYNEEGYANEKNILGRESARADVVNKGMQPEFKRLAAENTEARTKIAEITAKANQMYKTGQLSIAQRNADIKLATFGLNKQKFEDTKKGYTDIKVAQSPDGDGYNMIGINKKTGKSEPLTYEDGTIIKGSNPDIWKSIMANLAIGNREIEAAGDEAGANITAPKAEDYAAKSSQVLPNIIKAMEDRQPVVDGVKKPLSKQQLAKAKDDADKLAQKEIDGEFDRRKKKADSRTRRKGYANQKKQVPQSTGQGRRGRTATPNVQPTKRAKYVRPSNSDMFNMAVK